MTILITPISLYDLMDMSNKMTRMSYLERLCEVLFSPPVMLALFYDAFLIIGVVVCRAL